MNELAHELKIRAKRLQETSSFRRSEIHRLRETVFKHVYTVYIYSNCMTIQLLYR